MLVERDKQLQLILSRVEATRHGGGSVILLGGEAGMGKTSLLETVRNDRPQDCEIAWGGCDALFTPRPLGPLFDMARFFGNEITALLDEGAVPGKLYSAILKSLEGRKTPLVMIFEDVHWADNATLDCLRFLGRRISMLKAVMILSFRNDEVDDAHPLTQVTGDFPSAHTSRIDLTALSLEGLQQLAGGAAMDAENLHRITGGNPFFVTEILAAGNFGDDSVPASVLAATGARLSRLDKEPREFLETFSVIPGVISRALLAAMFGPQGELQAAHCLDRKLLVQTAEGDYRFRHELVRLATLARLSRSRQQAIHRRVFEALQKFPGERLADQLVHHAAGALDGAGVLKHAPQAAKTAASLGAHQEAAAHLSTALKYVNMAEPEMAAQLYEDWAYEAGIALNIDEEVLEARRHAITLWRALGRQDKVGENMRWLSRMHWYRGEAAEAGQMADDAVRLLEETPPSPERAMAYSTRSQLHMLNDRMDAAIEWGERALALARDIDADEVEAHALNNIASAKLFRGDVTGKPLMEESLEISLRNGFHEQAARVYTNYSEYAIEFCDFELAEKILSEGIAFDTQHDLDVWSQYLIGRLAQLRLMQGRLADAETICSGVLKQKQLSLLIRLPALQVLARTRTRMGEEDAHALLEEALVDARATDEFQYIVPVRLGLIEYAWLNDRPDIAREHLSALAETPASAVHPWRLGEAAVWANRFGEQLPPGYHTDLPEPNLRELQGDYEGAAKLWKELGLPYSSVLSLMQVQGEGQVAALEKAARRAGKIGAEGALAKIRKMALAGGFGKIAPKKRRGPYRASRNHPLGLTKREQEILSLLAAGASNREISEKLSRSQRTVEHHVSAVLGKLGVESRMEAMLRVQNEPWLTGDAA